MRDAADWVDRYRVFWEGRLDALQGYVEQTSERGEETG